MSKNPNELKTEQRFLGRNGLIVFIAVMNMFIPLSIDLYLPALPTMADYFQAPISLVNLTLSGFFFIYAIGILLMGPLSDKWGRRPVLLFGIITYTVGSLFCGFAVNIYLLILWRMVQAVGAGAIVAVTTALLKDCFDGRIRETVLAVVQAMTLIAPLVAPVLGAFLLRFFEWQIDFYVLAAIGFITLIPSLLFQESLPLEERLSGDIFQPFIRLFTVAKEKRFSFTLLVFAIISAPFMGYIAVSSYIYVDFFGLSAQTYSFFFAANSAISFLGPVLYLNIVRRVPGKLFCTVSIAVHLVSGIAVLTLGGLSPWLFLLCFIPFTVAQGTLRPYSLNLLLSMQEGDTGSMSSLINAVYTIFGSLGMVAGSLEFGNTVFVLGCLMTAAAGISMLGWLVILKLKWKI